MDSETEIGKRQEKSKMREYMLKEGNWEEVNRNKEGKDGDEKNKLDKIERSKKYENDSEKKGMIDRVCDKLDAFKDKIANKENKERNEKNKNDGGENEKEEKALNSVEQKQKNFKDSLKVENYEKNEKDSPNKKDSSEGDDESGEKGNQGRAIYDDGR